MSEELLIAGGGIGGLAAALAARRAGFAARLLEQAQAFSEAGAGIQLGPNASALLRDWGVLQGELGTQVARPERLCVRDARRGGELATLALGAAFEQRYGAPYLTVHRADLQQALLAHAQAAGGRLHTATQVVALRQDAERVQVQTAGGAAIEAGAVVGADGLWSAVRQQLLGDGPPRATGHLAYRAMLRRAELPPEQRRAEVTAWLGPDMHFVTYPVRGGDWLNVVCLVEGKVEGDAHGWDHPAVASQLQALLPLLCPALRGLLERAPQWRLWALHDRPPLASAQGMARGRVALLGDAAHPMLPYLAQGAGMALEDARELQRVLAAVAGRSTELPAALQRYALNRWQRCARVQRRALRNARIFHAAGPLRWGRDLSLRLLGARLLDLPWLYGGGAP